MKEIWIILQARTGSIRLKEKILANICGKPLLFHVVQRLKRVTKEVSGIVIATTTNPEDEAVVKLAGELGVRSFRGSEDDVLERYVGAASQVGAKIIVRATGDNPLCSPEAIDWALAKHHKADSDYTFVSGLPIGVAFSVVSYNALCQVHQLLESLNPHREHVTSFIEANPDQFKIKVV
ncbi:MAG: NTP transferase domain-containing protein, partial [Proteobacteria bacterium]|nr:NTP transferase domain-containing protein [Pseudomonadota bacterium]